jgi:hypothetical protein
MLPAKTGDATLQDVEGALYENNFHDKLKVEIDPVSAHHTWTTLRWSETVSWGRVRKPVCRVVMFWAPSDDTARRFVLQSGQNNPKSLAII